ncbi:hypothetical protein [Streptomyces macrosporus]
MVKILARSRRALGAVAVSSCAAMAMATPAWASSEDVSAMANRGDVCFTGVCGSATFSFQRSDHVGDISMSVADTRCDGNDVYIRFVVYSTATWETTKRYDSNGCNNGYKQWHGLSIDAGSGVIHGVRVKACVDDAGTDTCQTSGYFDNPRL